jgi:hypothetical protein
MALATYAQSASLQPFCEVLAFCVCLPCFKLSL